MKLLLDQNLSDRIPQQIADLYPDSSHVKNHGLDQADDEIIWSFARDNQFVIVSKDSDFHLRGLIRGHPPKFIYLRVGNCATRDIVALLRREHATIEEFGRRKTEALFVLA